MGFRVESETARYLILTTPRHGEFYRAITLPSSRRPATTRSSQSAGRRSSRRAASSAWSSSHRCPTANPCRVAGCHAADAGHPEDHLGLPGAPVMRGNVLARDIRPHSARRRSHPWEGAAVGEHGFRERHGVRLPTPGPRAEVAEFRFTGGLNRRRSREPPGSTPTHWQTKRRSGAERAFSEPSFGGVQPGYMFCGRSPAPAATVDHSGRRLSGDDPRTHSTYPWVVAVLLLCVSRSRSGRSIGWRGGRPACVVRPGRRLG